MTKSSLILGIDPGKQTGTALYDVAQEKFINLETMDFWSCFNYGIMCAAHTIVIEVSTSPTVFHKAGSSLPANQTTAMRVGGVLRESVLLAQGFELAGKNVVRVEPNGIAKKMSVEQFQKVTGWTKRTNQHCRDAALMCYRWRGGK